MPLGEGSGDGERGGDGACGSGLSQMGGVLGRQSYSGVAAATGGGGKTATLVARAVMESLKTSVRLRLQDPLVYLLHITVLKPLQFLACVAHRERQQRSSGATVPPLESANDALRERLSIHTKDWDSEWE